MAKDRFPVLFLGGCIVAIHHMRQKGLTDAFIAEVLVQVRAAALIDERNRQHEVFEHNPPVIGIRAHEVVDQITEIGNS
jgi:hypothetical protein